jgi:hypothetical protein
LPVEAQGAKDHFQVRDRDGATTRSGAKRTRRIHHHFQAASRVSDLIETVLGANGL